MGAVESAAGAVLIGVTRLVSGSVTRWVDCRPETRQRIYYGNHSSHLDIALLWASLPGPIRKLVRPVAARDYWEGSACKRFLALRVLGAIMIDRHFEGVSPRAALKSVQDTVAGLGHSGSLIIFPEGTRGRGERLAPFHSGIYHIAKRLPGVELVPVYLANLNRILPKGALLPVPLLSMVTFGPPLTLAEDESKTLFLDRLRDALLALSEI
jgi:1-acyl-sn-glycerol-3-phosphate acyltransferase